MAFKNSWEPFESFGRVCALFAGMVAVAYIAHLVTQEWGDYMIYWTIAVPVVVWWVWFFWNLIKAPHKISEEESATAAQSKLAPPNFTRFVFVVVIVSAFMGLLAAKNWQIAQLRKQLNPPKQISIAPNPLSTDGDLDISSYSENDQVLYRKACAAREDGSFSKNKLKWDKAAKYYEESYMDFLKLAIRHSSACPFAADQAGNIASAYRNIGIDESVADDAKYAISHIKANSVLNTNDPEMKPAVDLYNKLKNKYPNN
jgi:hypothetical protein